MLENISISKKLPFVVVFFALISMMVAGIASYVNIKSSVESLIKNNIFSILESRRNSLYNYFDSLENEILFHGDSPLVKDAFRDFLKSFESIPGDKENYLKNQYIVKNPFSSGQKHYLHSANDKSSYSLYHEYYHPIFMNLVQSNNYYDMFFIDANGNLIYTVKKDDDYATNLISGHWRDTPLAKIFFEINRERKMGRVIYSDFENYRPSNNDPASFIGVPVFNQEKEYIGALVFQLTFEPINNIMRATAGMGLSGESYLVGSDYLMRSNSRFIDHNSILRTKVDTDPTRLGLQGLSGGGLFIDYRGREVFSAYAPISFKGVEWVIVVDIDREEVFSPIFVMSKIFLISNMVVFVFVIFVGYLLGSSISNPIRTMTETMLRLARNELASNIDVNKRKDEIGQMAKALTVFKENATKRQELQKKLEFMAGHDSLTGIKNRKSAIETLELIIEKEKNKNSLTAVIFIDLDNFKKVNDTFGHQAGDRLLCNVSQSLSDSVRKTDTVARIGGDEFLIIVPSMTDRNSINHFVEKLMSSVYSTINSNKEFSSVSLSIGISIFPSDDSEVDGLVKKSDTAMYAAKQRGKNNYLFWGDVN